MDQQSQRDKLECAVALAIKSKLSIGMHPWPEIHGLEAAASAAIAECSRWRSKEEREPGAAERSEHPSADR